MVNNILGRLDINISNIIMVINPNIVVLIIEGRCSFIILTVIFFY